MEQQDSKFHIVSVKSGTTPKKKGYTSTKEGNTASHTNHNWEEAGQ
jgi:hypothetical protein